MTTIHQIIVGAGPGDAITQMALDIRDELRCRGSSEIFARFIDPVMLGEVRTLDHLPAGRPRDVVVYHSSYGDPEVTRALLRRPERLVLVYHNITPSSFFIHHEPAFAAGLEWGRHELTLLRDRVSLTIADSAFNARELRELGFTDVHTVPAGAQPRRLAGVTPTYGTVKAVRHSVPDTFVLSVSQLLPHKRQEVLIQALHILQSIHGMDIGLVLVGAPRSPSYERALHELARRLRVRHLWFAGRQSDSSLATLYRSARVFASASMHEGLGIPPLEAMAFSLPTVVRDAGATAETVGSGALVLPNDAGPLLFAEAIRRSVEDETLRAALISEGSARLLELSTTTGTDAFVGLLETIAAAS